MNAWFTHKLVKNAQTLPAVTPGPGVGSYAFPLSKRDRHNRVKKLLRGREIHTRTACRTPPARNAEPSILLLERDHSANSSGLSHVVLVIR
jgi:hypothetical protein